jgi:hypothetical protein
MSSARAVSLTFQSCWRSLASRNARSAACLNSSKVPMSVSAPSPPPSHRAAPDQPLDVGERDARARGQDQQPLDRVAQLAHVARPVELRSRCIASSSIPWNGSPSCARARPGSAHEQRDVLAPLAQRRHAQRHHVEPVVQVLAEAPSAISSSSSLLVAATTRTSTFTGLCRRCA